MNFPLGTLLFVTALVLTGCPANTSEDPPCREGFTLCGEVCTDTRTDGLNCGACGTVCDKAACVSGVCLPACQNGLTACPGGCLDTNTDPLNCGDCGIQCPEDRVCHTGRCQLP